MEVAAYTVYTFDHKFQTRQAAVKRWGCRGKRPPKVEIQKCQRPANQPTGILTDVDVRDTCVS